MLLLLVVECHVYSHTSVTRHPPQQQDSCVPVPRSSGSICSGLVPVPVPHLPQRINKRNAMFKLNQIFQLRGRALIRDRPLQPLLLALPYIQLNASVTCAFSLDGTCRDVGLRLRTPASPRPKRDDQQR